MCRETKRHTFLAQEGHQLQCVLSPRSFEMMTALAFPALPCAGNRFHVSCTSQCCGKYHCDRLFLDTNSSFIYMKDVDFNQALLPWPTTLDLSHFLLRSQLRAP